MVDLALIAIHGRNEHFIDTISMVSFSIVHARCCGQPLANHGLPIFYHNSIGGKGREFQ